MAMWMGSVLRVWRKGANARTKINGTVTVNENNVPTINIGKVFNVALFVQRTRDSVSKRKRGREGEKTRVGEDEKELNAHSSHEWDVPRWDCYVYWAENQTQEVEETGWGENDCYFLFILFNYLRLFFLCLWWNWKRWSREEVGSVDHRFIGMRH